MQRWDLLAQAAVKKKMKLVYVVFFCGGNTADHPSVGGMDPPNWTEPKWGDLIIIIRSYLSLCRRLPTNLCTAPSTGKSEILISPHFCIHCRDYERSTGLITVNAHEREIQSAKDCVIVAFTHIIIEWLQFPWDCQILRDLT